MNGGIVMVNFFSTYIYCPPGEVHHIAFEVDNIALEISRLKEEGFVVLNEKPKKGADNKLVVFLHPKSTNGVLIELCQEITNKE